MNSQIFARAQQMFFKPRSLINALRTSNISFKRKKRSLNDPRRSHISAREWKNEIRLDSQTDVKTKSPSSVLWIDETFAAKIDIQYPMLIHESANSVRHKLEYAQDGLEYVLWWFHQSVLRFSVWHSKLKCRDSAKRYDQQSFVARNMGYWSCPKRSSHLVPENFEFSDT